MGLDMFAYTMLEHPDYGVDFDVNRCDATQIHYWRKHPGLHGWMEQLYLAKGGGNDDFNCVNLALTMADLDRLEADIRQGSLPLTHGFFFGESDGSETEDDLDFIADARAALESGLCVFYTSWW